MSAIAWNTQEDRDRCMEAGMNDYLTKPLYVVALMLVAIVWLIVLLSAERLQRVLGPAVMTAFERLMGLILAAMAVELLAAAEGIEFRRPLKSSAKLEEAHSLIRAHVAARSVDRVFGPDIEAISQLVAANSFARFTGPLL